MAASTIISDIQKEIKYDRQTKDYNCLISIDGGAFESIGFASNYSEAERKCNAYAYDYLTDTGTHETAATLVMADEPAYTPIVQVEQRSTDDEDEPTTWTEFECGAVHIGANDSDGSPADLIIHGREITSTPITYAMLSALHADLGALLAHPGIQAALPVGETPDPKAPPCATTRVRVRSFTNDCGFPLLLSCQIGLALSAKRAEFGLTEDRIWKLMIAAGEVIDAAFDLSVGFGILGKDTKKLVDSAYQLGFHEALDAIKSFMELKEKAPEKALALVSRQRIRAEAGAPPVKQAA